ncbi:hypothetical protein [Hymenobacter aerophilus]|uniref:hypothetical protein n=1 Tax=Hymenobacter aerophilus TaxID=119644 RepID=UPI0012F78F65|nr:hypothetical protein [Hymenobacter aerophilus]
MTDERKKLYRELLYWAMIDVRSQSYAGSRLSSLWNAFGNRKRLRFAQAVANWLHNLALYSALDFKSFQED